MTATAVAAATAAAVGSGPWPLAGIARQAQSAAATATAVLAPRTTVTVTTAVAPGRIPRFGGGITVVVRQTLDRYVPKTCGGRSTGNNALRQPYDFGRLFYRPGWRCGVQAGRFF